MAITANRFFSMDPARLTAEAEDRFFTGLKTGNDTFKRTASARFAAVDERCVALFRANDAVLAAVLDVGVSSGSTTLALQARLRDAGYAPAITGTDRSIAASLIRLGPGLTVLVDEAGHPLQYEIAGMPVRAWRRRIDAWTGMGLALRALGAATRGRIATRLAAGSAVRAVRLLSPRLTASDIAIEQNDVFEPTPAYRARFDFVRVANLLNLGYFSERQLRAALVNVAGYLAGPGSWLLVARCVGTQTAGTVFRVSPDGHRLTIVERIGAGSEIEALVLDTPVPAAAGR